VSDGFSWEALGALATAGALIVSAISAMMQASANSLLNLTGVHGRIQDQYYRLGEVKSEEDPKLYSLKQTLWDESFFNELEWLCALYLRGDIPEDLMVNHFGPPLIHYHDRIYLPSVHLHPRAADPRLYRKFRTVVAMLRSPISVRKSVAARMAGSSPDLATPAALSRANQVPTHPYTRTGRVDLYA
jgi:hypothetical protein